MEATENVLITDAGGRSRGEFTVLNHDPRFYLERGETGPEIRRGDIMRRQLPNAQEEARPIVGVMVTSSPFSGQMVFLLAPRPVKRLNPDASYITQRASDDDAILLELRPGTTILGGRNSGFYDDYGVIIDAQATGGDPKAWEDWAYRVIGRSNYEKLASQWILLGDIHSPISGPTSITGFATPPNAAIDQLLEAGERDLINYFAANPRKIETLTPKQFEQLVSAIYKNLGFSTEPIGAWNQADGGVDIIAVGKTEANTEIRLAIQCKTSAGKLSARPIRELAGVLDAFKAHQGIIATTARFTSSARSEVEGHLWRISLQDRDEIYRRLLALALPTIPI